MNALAIEGKKVLIGITGSIAAYKIAFLTRLLVKNGAEVKIIMTEAATQFISALTLATLSKNDVLLDIHSEEKWNNHVELGLWADILIVAPATANTLSKMASGESDNMLCATYLSSKCPVFIAPAMDLDMWKHPSTKGNIEKLEAYGNLIIPVGHGELASGLVGDGRMAEPEDIVQFINSYFVGKQDLTGKTAIVTAGPTYEAIDPVRFIGNRSSGKMGIAIASVLKERGATVHLILGPSTQTVDPEINLVRVESAQDMYEASLERFKSADIAVFAAAVADFTPDKVADQKIKKTGDRLNISLKKTKDIALELSKIKEAHQFTVGFALETNNALENAMKKIAKKKFNFIVLNSLEDKGAGFAHDTNKVTIIKDNGNSNVYPLKSKKAVAIDIVEEIVKSIK